MFRVRPAQQNDLDNLMKLVEKAGLGMTTMPQTQQAMLKRIYLSQEAFARAEAPEQNETFFMVLENENGDAVGTTSIFTKLGYDRPFYSYRRSHLSNHSPELDVRLNTDLLYLVNDYHGYTEIGTLFVDPEHRGAGVGKLLSFSRFMLMAANPGRFGDDVMAEIRGWSDDGSSFPFWEHLAKKFFNMDFVEADRRSASDFRFIADLMPKHPIYTELLAPEAQEILGKPHEVSKPAMDLLLSQGFRKTKHIDIFDGGPSIATPTNNIEMVRQAKKMTVKIGKPLVDGERSLASSIGMSDFTCIQVNADFSKDILEVSDDMLRSLDVNENSTILVSPLKGRK